MQTAITQPPPSRPTMLPPHLQNLPSRRSPSTLIPRPLDQTWIHIEVQHVFYITHKPRDLRHRTKVTKDCDYSQTTMEKKKYTTKE